MIHISEIGVGNMVVVAAYIEGMAVPGTEHLSTASKLGREVEVSCVEHALLEIEKSASGSEEWLNAAVVHPIHLRTGNPANREWAACVNQPAIAVF